MLEKNRCLSAFEKAKERSARDVERTLEALLVRASHPHGNVGHVPVKHLSGSLVLFMPKGASSARQPPSVSDDHADANRTTETTDTLLQVMRYGTLNGGKRLRAFLLLSVAALFDVDRQRALRVAAAVEMIHAYSLVHDDLPAMDNDTLRRGKPTCHVVFDEASAILAGDALQCLAFEVLADADTHEDPLVRLRLVQALTHSVGHEGMVGGQMLDIIGENRALSLAEVTRMHRMKTGMLIEFSCDAGAILGRAGDTLRGALRAYAHDLGLAFQITDDILDAVGDAEKMGKSTGKDVASKKRTFVSALGIDQAREQAYMLGQQAKAHLHPFDGRAETLYAVVDFVLERTT